jgi:hypothetical protein
MKKNTLLFFLLFLFSNAIFGQLQHDWSLNGKEYVAGNNALLSKNISRNQVIQDAAGNSYSIGSFTGNIDFDPIGDTVLTANGSFYSIYFVKYDPNGNLIFAKQITSTDNIYATAIAMTSSGEIVISGYFKGVVDFDMDPVTTNLISPTSPSTGDTFIAKMDTNGNLIFIKQFRNGLMFFSLITDASGAIYGTGEFQALNLDMDPGPGTATFSSAGASDDIFVAKYDSNGNYVFAFVLGSNSTSIECGIAIGLDASQNIYVTGQFFGTVDFDPSSNTMNLTSSVGSTFVAKYTSAGIFQYSRYFTNTSSCDVRDMAVDASGNAFIVGAFSQTLDLDPGTGTVNVTASGSDMFMVKLNASGAFVFGKQLDATASSIILDASNNVFICGVFSAGTVDFDPGPGISNLSTTSSALYVASYTSVGNFISCCQASSSSNYFPDLVIDPANNIVVFCGDDLLKFNSGGIVSFQKLYAEEIAGGGTPGNEQARILTRDSGGNIYICGTYTGSINFAGDLGFKSLQGASATYAYFAKYDSTGTCLFVKRLGTTNTVPVAICVDALGQIYITGQFKTSNDFDPSSATALLTTFSSGVAEIFFAKYDAMGNYIFAKQLSFGGASGAIPGAIATDGGGNIYIGGLFAGTCDFDPSSGTSYMVANPYSLFFAKYNSSGGLVYAKQLDNTVGNITSLLLDASNNIFLSGHFSGTTDFDPNAGTVMLTSGGSQDVFFAKYSNSGNYLFAKKVGGTLDDEGLSFKIDNLGNSYITGYFNGTVDFDPSAATANLISAGAEDIFIAKYNAGGSYVYAKRIGNAGADISRSIAIDGSGNANITGSFSGTVDFDPGTNINYLVSSGGTDIFIARYNNTGNFIFAKSIGSTGNDIGNTIYTNNSGVVSYAGSFEASADFNPDNAAQTPLTAVTGSDLFVSQFQQSFFTITTTIVNGSVSCFGDTDGSAYVTPTGNQPPYTYLWSPSGITDSLATGLEGGQHTITVTDAFGLTISQTITIAQPAAPLTATLSSQSNVTCFGGTNGYALINATGGTAPYTYSWSPSGGTSNSSSSLSASTYTVTVTDANGCQTTVSFTITQPSQLNINIVSQLNVSCFGGANGTATVSATGGSGGNSFSWSPISTSGPTATNLAAGNYTATVNDLNGCLAQVVVNITQPPLLAVTVSSITNVTCASASDGAAVVTASGGTSPYSYNWSPAGGTSYSANNLPVGSYTVAVTDGKGCTASTPVSILNLIPSQEICVVSADSATGNYNVIVWEKPAILSNIDSFFVYREITLGTFQKIGAVHRDSLSTYNDFAANPNSTSYKYKIKVLDTCGSVGDFGLYHNSIHLQYLSLGNFQWTFYEIENTSNQVASYNFYRDDNATGNFVLLQIIPGNNNSFTDVNYASYPNARYRVDVNWLSGNVCTATRASISTSRSNIKNNSTVATGIAENDFNAIAVYPNPTQGIITIEYPAGDKYDLQIFNSLGQKVYHEEFSAGNSAGVMSKKVDIRDFAKGVFILKISSGKGSTFKRIIKE